MVVREPDQLHRVDAEIVADHGEFIGEGDVDIPEGVLDELGHLGGAGIGLQEFALDERAVEGADLFRGLGRQTTDDPVVFHKLDQGSSGNHPFGAVREIDGGRVHALLAEAGLYALHRADGGR